MNAPQQAETATTPVPDVEVLQSPTSLLKAAYRLMRERYRSVIGLILLSTLGSIWSYLTNARQASESATSLIQRLNTAALDSASTLVPVGVPRLTAVVSDASGALSAGVAVTVIVVVLAAIYISVSVSVGLMYGFSGRDPSTSWDAFRRGLGSAGPFIWVSFMFALVLMAGLLLFIIPGIYWGVLYGLAVWALVIDGSRGTAALTRSHALVKGRWWKVAYRVFALGVFAFVMYLGVSVVAGILTLLVGDIAGAVAGGALAGLLIEPLTLCCFIMLYRELARTRPVAA